MQLEFRVGVGENYTQTLYSNSLLKLGNRVSWAGGNSHKAKVTSFALPRGGRGDVKTSYALSLLLLGRIILRGG